MKLSEVRRLEADEAATLARQLQDLLGSPGWRVVQGILEEQSGTHEALILRAPNSESADSYALKQAHMAGYVSGIKAASEAVKRVLRDAEAVVASHQQAAERRLEEAQRG